MTNIQEVAKEIGFEAMPAPGQVAFLYHVGDKEGTSSTIRCDNRDPNAPKFEALAGLTGKKLEIKELHDYAIILQCANEVELKVKDGQITDMQGKLLGKDVAGTEVMEKVTGFFGSLAKGAIGKAQEYAMAAVKMSKEILPTLGRIPFASELTGRSLAFAKAAAPKSNAPAKPAMAHALAPSGPGLGSKARRIARTDDYSDLTEDPENLL